MSILTAIIILIILSFVWVYKDVFYPNNKFNVITTVCIAVLCLVPYLNAAAALVCLAVYAQHAWLKFKKTPV